ncbi:MAG: hypothetical protein WCH30_06610 [Chlorobiaceae bacterium]
MLATAEQRDFCEKPLLIAAQNSIVDSRFRDTDYRGTQNYIGESISFQQQRIHYICPKPEDIADLMAGLIAAHRKLKSSAVPALVHAAIISYGALSSCTLLKMATAACTAFLSIIFSLSEAAFQRDSCFLFLQQC